MITSTPTLVNTYFQLAAQGDSEAYWALFDDDAVVEDEGNTYRGIEAIRQWRAEVPQVTYDITAVEAAADGGIVVTATVTGDFPGSPFAGLKFHFVDFDDAKIRTLYIRT
jgi:ketosteroid isomerase-like protein